MLGTAVNSTGTRVYVADGGYESGSVFVIAADNNNSISQLTPNISRFYSAIAVHGTGTGTRIYLTTNNDSVVVLDADGGVLAEIALPGDSNPQGIAVSSDGTRVYTANYGINSAPSTVSVIATDDGNKVTTVEQTGSVGARGVAVTTDGTRVYTANYDSGTVSVMDTTNNYAITTFPLEPNGIGPYAVAVTTDGSRVYTANYYNSTVSVIS